MYSLALKYENKKGSSPYKNITLLNPNTCLPPNSINFFTSDKNQNIRLHSAKTSLLISKFQKTKTESGITKLKFNPKTKNLFACKKNGQIDIYTPSSKTNNKKTIKPHFSKINEINFSADFKKMATSSNDKTVKIFALKISKKKLKIEFGISISHNSFVLKASFSGDGFSVFSLEKNCFKITRIQKCTDLGDRKIVNFLDKGKEEIFCLRNIEAKGEFFCFHVINESLVLILYAFGHFEILDVISEEKIKSFSIPGVVIVKSEFCKKGNRVLLLTKRENGNQKIIVFDVFDFLQDKLFELDCKERVEDVLFTKDGEYFLAVCPKVILLWKDNELLRLKKNKTKRNKKLIGSNLKLKSENVNEENRIGISVEEKIQNESNMKKKENPAYNLITNQLTEFSNSLKLITDGFIQLDKKITKNEERTNKLLEIASVKKEKILRKEEFLKNFENQIPVYCDQKVEIQNFENENGNKNLNLNNFEDDNPENNFKKYQIKYDISDDYCQTETIYNGKLFDKNNNSEYSKENHNKISERINPQINMENLKNKNIENFSKLQDENIICSISEKNGLNYIKNKNNEKESSSSKLVDLNEIEDFINSRENVSQKLDNNFSFKKNSQFDEENIFAEVIGKSMKEKTMTFNNDEVVDNLMCNSFKISKENKDLMFNTMGKEQMKNVDLHYSMRVSSK